MMIQILRRIIGAILFAGMAGGCHDQIIVREPLHTWTLDSVLFGSNKFLLTSFKLDESKLLVANSFSIWEVHANRIDTNFVEGSYIPHAPATWYPPAINKTISVSVLDKDHLLVFPTRCAACIQQNVIITADYSTSTTSKKEFLQADQIYSGHAGGYPVTDDGYLLAPHEIDFELGKVTCLLIKIDTAATPEPVKGPQLSLNSIKPVTLNGVYTLGGSLYFSATYYDKFFISVYDEFYRVDKEGNVKTFDLESPSPKQMFMLNNILFALSGRRLFQSIDHGETWTVFADDIGNFSNFNYFNVGNELYAASGQQLSRVTLDDNTMSLTELDNDGLETNTITSINKCGGYVFVTTLAGLFYRDSTGFNLPKE